MVRAFEKELGVQSPFSILDAFDLVVGLAIILPSKDFYSTVAIADLQKALLGDLPRAMRALTQMPLEEVACPSLAETVAV